MFGTRKLGRTSDQRKAMLRAMTTYLFENGKVEAKGAYVKDLHDLDYDLPILNPVDEQGCYTEGPWKGRLVVDSELEVDIIKYLAKEDKLFKKQKMEHNYPHCWRCKTPLVYYSKPSLYIKVTDFKDKIIADTEVKCHKKLDQIEKECEKRKIFSKCIKPSRHCIVREASFDKKKVITN